MKKKKFLRFLLILIILAVIALFIADIKTVLIIFSSLLILKAYILYKEKISQELIIAFIFSLAITSYYFYEYTTFNIILFGINFFPVVSWTFGLVVLREIYERVKIKHKFFAISLFYIIVLIILEYVGYHFLGIRLNSNFPGLWKLDAFHSPPTLQVIYFLVGPVYLLVTDYFNVG